MDLKTNINQIHFNLSQRFENTKIEENESIKLGKFFKILVNESLYVIIPFKNIRGVGNFNWYYPENPSNSDSSLIERVSNVNNLTDCLVDILENKRFSEDYKKTM